MNTVVSPTHPSGISNLRGATSLSCAFNLEIRRRLSRFLRWLKRLFGNSDFAGSLSHNVDLNRRAKNALMLTSTQPRKSLKHGVIWMILSMRLISELCRGALGPDRRSYSPQGSPGVDSRSWALSRIGGPFYHTGPAVR